MKNILKIIVIVFISVAFAVIMYSCKKDKATPPILTTAEPSEITQKTVSSGGNITSDGGEEIIIAGICWSTSANPSIKDKHTNDAKELGSFTSKLIGLIPNTKYYIRAYAYNKAGAGYGNEVTFTTSPITLATLTTTDVTLVTSNSATSGGIITDDGGGIITARGICWGTSANPTIIDEHSTDGTGTGNFTSNMKCLSSATTYYVRAYATNSAGTAYGDQQSFTAEISPIIFNPNLNYGSVADIEGNCYKTIQIGNQTWMAENLMTTNYNDGSIIPNVTGDNVWSILITDAYCWYYNDEATYRPVYGALYNWYAVNTGKLCPTGWHIPSDAEWHTLVLTLDVGAQDILGTESTIAGGKLKEIGTIHWKSQNDGATNESGFTAIPGGLRQADGVCRQEQIDGYAFYWSSTEVISAPVTNAYSRMVGYNATNMYKKSGAKVVGASIRCVKD